MELENAKAAAIRSVLLDNDGAAEFIGASPKTLPRWRWAGTGPAYLKVGRSIRYRRSDLEAWLAGRFVATKDQNRAAQVDQP